MKRTVNVLVGLCFSLVAIAVLYSGPCRSFVPYKDEAKNNTPSDAKRADKIQILYTRDVLGNAELCGCSPEQKGGVPRIATAFRVPEKPDEITLKVDCGNYLPHADDPVAPVHIPQMVSGYQALKYDAVNVGAVEAGYDLKGLQKLAGSGLPLVSASLYDKADRPIFLPLRVVNKGGVKIAFVGLVGPNVSSKEFTVLRAEAALKKIEPQLTKEKADLVCLLGDFSVEEAIAVGGIAKGAQLIVSAQDLKFAPSGVKAFVATASGRYGATVGRAVLRRNGEGFDFDNELIPLTKDVDGDLTLLNTVKEAGERARRELKISPHRQASLGDFVGSAECKVCHAREHEIWEASKHGHAFNILVEQKADKRIDCVSCHVTGYQSRDAAYRVEHVGCESCHGPGKKHIAFMTSGQGQAPAMRAGETSCVKCHNEVNSPLFTFNYYWSKIQH